MTYSNGVKTEIIQDGRERPKNIVARHGVMPPYVDLTMGFDSSNNISLVSDAANQANSRNYGYDGIGRLVQVTSGGVDYPIEYDGAGNIVSQTFGGQLKYNYDVTTNRLASTSGVKVGSYTYDARGNVTSNGNIRFQYDDNSRLSCAKCGEVDQITYDYSAAGTRVSRSKGSEVLYLVYALDGNLLMEFNPATNERQEHVYLAGQKVATNRSTAYFNTGIGLTVSASAVSPGQAVTLTAVLSGGRLPDGAVNFYDNGNLIGSGLIVNGKATLVTEGLNFGYHNFTADYVGDGVNTASNTAAPTLVESGAVTASIIGIVNGIILND